MKDKVRAYPRDGVATRDAAIYDNLYAAIVEHRLPPGTKLPEDALSEVYGVSRTGIRKVLQRLAYERLVALRPNRGACVARPSAKEAREVFAARRIVECGAMAAIAQAASPIALAPLRDIVAREQAAQHAGERHAAIQLSGDFHLRLLALAGNQTLSDILSGLVSRSSLVLATHGTPLASGCRHAEHGDVLDLLAAGQGEAAAQWMERHLHDIERAVALDDGGPAAPDLKAILRAGASRPR